MANTVGSLSEYFLTSLGEMLLIFTEMRLKNRIFRKYHSYFIYECESRPLLINIELTLRELNVERLALVFKSFVPLQRQVTNKTRRTSAL